MPVFILAAGLIAIADQAVKHIIRSEIPMNGGIWVINGFFRITHIENSGVALGIFGGIPHPAVRWILVGVITLAGIGITAYWAMNRSKGFMFDTACGLILGGAIGNLIDRVRVGRITDFLEFGIRNATFPVFNVADSAVTVGVGLFIILVMLEGKKEKNASGIA